MLADLRSTLRLFRCNRGLAAVAIATLALGIGANTTVVALLKSVVLSPLPGVAGADRIVSVLGVGQSGQPFALSYPDYLDLRDDNEVLAGLAGHAVVPFNLTIDGAAERVWGELVTGNFFLVFGVGAHLGRTLLPSDDEAPRGQAVAVISDDLWRRRFGADPGVVGRTIAVGRRPYTIVGVTEPPFRGAVVGLSLHVFVPATMQPEVLPFGNALELRDSHWLIADGRLKPGVTLEQATVSMALAGERLARAYPYDFVRERAVLRPLWRSPVGAQATVVPLLGVLMAGALEAVVHEIDPGLPLFGVRTMERHVESSLAGVSLAAELLGAAGLLALLLAAVGLYGVMANGVRQRTHEIGVRVALGASSGDVLRLVAGQTLGLTLAGVGAGLGIAYAAARIVTGTLYGAGSGGPGSYVVAVGLLLSVAGLATLVPALRALRVPAVTILRHE